MDYDDNDFHSQNLHLAGEGNNKFPPVLRPYALPKFDFDESLHGSLRFDSLVETEVFLGIESNEDSQWIEDFSRGSSEIQFSSSAAESCSIPRRNNVWSEATSSESVEMLLKSVGQEELIPAQTNTKELDACDELGCIIKQMEPNLKQDNNIAATVEDVTNLEPTLLPGQLREKFPGLDDHGSGQQPQVEDSSRSHKGDTSVDQGLGDLTAISVEVGLPMEKGSPFVDSKGDGINQRQVDSVGNVSLDNRIQQSSASGTQVDNAVAAVQNIIQGNDGLNNKDAPDNVNEIADKKLDISGTNKVEDNEKGGVLSQGAQMHTQVLNEEIIEIGVSHLDNPLCLSPRKSVEETSTIETNFCIVEESCAKPNEDSGIEMHDGSAVDAHEVSPVVVGGDSTVERHEVEDSNGSLLDKDLVTKTAPSLFSMKDNKGFEDQVDGRCSGYGAVNSSLPQVCSSAEFVSEINAEGHVLSTTLSEKDIPAQGDANKNVSVYQKEFILPSVGRDMDRINNQGVETFSFGECSTGELVVVSKSQPDSTSGDVSANGASVPSGNGINTDSVFDPKMEVSPLSVVFTCSVANKEIAAKISAEASLSNVKAVPEVATGADSVSDSKKGCASAGEQMLCKSADGYNTEDQIESHSLITKRVSQECIKDKDVCVAVCDSNANGRDSTEALVKGNDEEDGINVSDPPENDEMPGSVLSAKKESLQDISHKVQGEKAVTESGDTRVEQVPVPSTNVEQEGSADLDKPASGSPTLIRNIELSHDKSNKEGIQKSSDKSVSVAEVSDGDAIKLQAATKHPNKYEATKDDSSFTFEVNPLADLPQKDAKKRQAFSNIETSKVSQIMDGSASNSGLGQLDPKVAQDPSHGSPKVSDVAIVCSGSKGISERKTRRASGKATAKETAKKGKSARETSSMKSEREAKMTSVSLNSSSVSQLVQSNEMQQFGNLDSNIMKPFVLATSTAGLPDLNSSVSPSAVFHQPFTDLQQVQLRAQIFVYGALIQGTAPDEAYMISAFGGPDGGRSIWENAWRSCIERLHGQKSHPIAPETPLQSRSGVRTPEQSIKQSVLQSKVVSSPIGRGSSKSTPAIVNPIVPFSSPLWSMPTPSGDTLQPSGMPRGPVMDYQRVLSPLHPHQTSGISNYVGHSPSWLSQANYGGPWMASPQTSAHDTSGRFSVQLPLTETVQLTPVKESSVHHSSAVKPTGPVTQNSASASIFAGSSSVLDATMISASGGQPTNPKPRKRKKNSVSENTGQNVLPTQPQTESVITSPVASSLSTSIAFTAPVGFVSKAPAEKLITSATPISTDLRKGDQNTEQRANLTEATLGKVEEAKVQAEDAAASAASAVSHSQQVWDQLGKQKNAGLLSDVETKLASAAVVIAAAAAVAKAAAAAAKVASNAALQAKLMAEEAVASGGHLNPCQINVISFPDGMKNLGKATPASILKGDDGTNSSSSILVAAREAARRRVEAASAAAKRAENMDAIVKAAELAAEAVSQAGKIVAMGDPLPLSELVAAGPEGYRIVAVTPELNSKSNFIGRENINVDGIAEGPNTLVRRLKEVPSDRKENPIANHGKFPPPRQRSSDDHDRLINVLSGFGATTAKDVQVQKGRKGSDLAKTIGVVPESENGSRSSIVQNESEKAETSKQNKIKEESLVEVFKDGSGFKAAWFPAKVLSLKDGKAYVEYAELMVGEEKLQEWVPLEGKGDEAPKIRIARPTNIMPFERTRKRRRAAMGDHTWSVGDRVDAWIQDSWQEGVITEKSKKDVSILTVNFPARGETSVIPAWQLHPSLIWKDGEWVEWSSSGESGRSSHGGDTPHEKRPRVRSPVAEAKGKDKPSKSVDVVESDKSDDPTLLALSSDETLFNIGKSSRDENRTNALRTKRTGLQKEGSRVIFGVPKPGKKRKFMEVSRHYVADRSGRQMSEANDSLKFTKYLMPQGQGSRGWKSSKTETNEKRAAISKPKVLKSGKPQNVSGRTIPLKDSVSNTAVSVPDDSAVTKDCVNHAENTLEKQNVMGFQSFSASDGATEGPILFSALALPSDIVPSKRMPTSNAKPEWVSKGRLAPAAAKLGKIEEDKTLNGNSVKSTSDPVEPRRSNRRIQPTSRLLEGLQSSLMVSKIPSVSHDKGHKTRSRGNNHG